MSSVKIKKETIDDIKYIIFGIIAAILINKVLGLALGTSLPIVAVVSESMTHDETTPYRHYEFLRVNLDYSMELVDSWPLSNGFNKGDVLVVKGVEEGKIEVGDVIVYNIKGQPVPIVHRVVGFNDGNLITKGDHNPTFDPWEVEKIRGEAIFKIPFLGWPKVILNSFLGGFR